MSKIVAVDVDLTVVDTFNPWMEWFESYTGGRKVLNEDGAYDLVPEMNRILAEIGVDLNPFDFWRKTDLYDNLEPVPGVVDVIRAMKDGGYTVVFVSSCVPEHTKSKKWFLDHHFGYAPFIATHEKELVAYDCLIDDKLYHIKQGLKARPNAMHILFTGVRADGLPDERENVNTMDCWSKICF